ERAAASALQRPEEVGVRARVGDANLSVGGHDLGLEEARGGHAEVLREAAESATGDESDDTDGGAAAALHVAAGLRRDGVVHLDPACAGLDRDGSPRASSRTALGLERVVQRDRAHLVGPDEERVGGVGGAEVAVAAALHDEAQAMLAREV